MQTGARRYNFGGVQMSCVDMPGALDAFFDFAAEGRGGYIACTCTHGIVDSQNNEQVRRILNESLLTLPDGMPTVWVGRLKGMPVRRRTSRSSKASPRHVRTSSGLGSGGRSRSTGWRATTRAFRP